MQRGERDVDNSVYAERTELTFTRSMQRGVDDNSLQRGVRLCIDRVLAERNVTQSRSASSCQLHRLRETCLSTSRSPLCIDRVVNVTHSSLHRPSC